MRKVKSDFFVSLIFTKTTGSIDMSTAQIIYEQYKVLPKRVRKELKELINKEEGEMTLMEELEQSLKEVKLMREGKKPKRDIRDILNG
jgi:uncharacterized membrane protein